MIETLVAQYAINHLVVWRWHSVCQTPGPEHFDWTFTPRGFEYILWRNRAYNQWAPSSNVPTRWEHKCGSIAYFISDGTKSGGNSFTYVIAAFCFKKRQIRAILAGDIH